MTVSRSADFTGLWANLDAIRDKTELPRFAPWWTDLIDRLRTDEKPGLETIAFAAAVTTDADLEKKALERYREALDGYIKSAIPEAREMYPELEADLRTGSTCKSLAYAYTFLYPCLSPADRKATLDEFRRGAGMLYKDAQAGAWWANSPNSNWTSHMLSGLALSALALSEDDAETCEAWLQFVEPILETMLDLAGEDGAGIEGPGYWTFCHRSIQEWVEALRNTGRADHYTHAFWKCCVDFPLYMMRPARSGLINLGDTGDGLGGSHFHYGVAAALDHGLSQWFGDRALESGSPSFWDLILYNPDIEPTPPDDQSLDRCFKSAHIASFRSGWDPNATFLILKGGSNAWSHCHLDLNSIFIDACGERLVIDPGPGPYSHDYFSSVTPEVSTEWHNTLTVDGADQRQPPRHRMSFDLEEGGDAYCRLTDFRSSDGIAMARGDATTAYGDFLDRFHRDVIYLKPDCFVIHDDIRAKEVRTQRHYQWLLHSGLPIVDREDGAFEVQGEKCRLVIHPILPDPCHHRFLEPRVPGKSPEGTRINCLALRPMWHHLWNVSPSQSPYPQWDPRSTAPIYGRDLQFLVLLTVVPMGMPYDLAVTPVDIPFGRGLKIVRGNRTEWVCFNPAGKRFETGAISSDAEKLVLRQEDGEPVSQAVIRGQTLIHKGRELL
jgi:hypothetical protein